ncbi:thiamine phosphate synthase [Desmospora activa]|uniref:Thiazole tautomerase (Transcriptional regulator TenI) n=1 Tax=Desmospora activa DSM 45169 TaxID=1121389 RepID=A0A2T4ZC18_9BACL|nr:thiamine phosphate synthase [Desmospora activa]PTM59443.1 thiazole tautomerase (transcriptional regulator TenI) [Desmospora activa DSM 45169]
MIEHFRRYPHGYRLSHVVNRQRPQLHLVVGHPYSLEQVVEVCQEAHSYLDHIHLRLKGSTAKTVTQWAEKLLSITSTLSHQLVINGMPEVAKTFNVGLHLPESAPFVKDHSRAVGVSVHSVASAQVKETAGAAYLFFGHVYDSQSKPGLPPQGVAALRKVVNGVTIPVIAIGGVEERRLAELGSTGCAGVAVISAIMDAHDPGETARRMREALVRHWT